jgi:sugar phosphate isomerase/epimerase
MQVNKCKNYLEMGGASGEGLENSGRNREPSIILLLHFCVLLRIQTLRMKRREFLSIGATRAMGVSLFPSLLSACSPAADPLHEFGLITNVVKTRIREDHRGTMEALAKMGYRYLEFGGTFGEEAGELSAFMKEIGLKPLAGGTSMSGLQGDGLQQQIDGCLAMDKKYLVCYWPWMSSAENLGWDEVKDAVDACNRMASVCHGQGLGFAWHNHDQEFGSIDGRVIYDYVLEHTAEEVCMEVDLYWAHKGGADIREYFKRYPGRFELVHVKDSYDSPERESFCSVGEGILDFEDLFSYREVAGFKHLIVENDQPPADELAGARTAIRHLNSLNF